MTKNYSRVKFSSSGHIDECKDKKKKTSKFFQDAHTLQKRILLNHKVFDDDRLISSFIIES
tara:strand:+ start:112 stop:294 length:183 start_codon:yes stop_codon:yes gene_type:complete